jgi:hypothetical protein
MRSNSRSASSLLPGTVALCLTAGVACTGDSFRAVPAGEAGQGQGGDGGAIGAGMGGTPAAGAGGDAAGAAGAFGESSAGAGGQTASAGAAGTGMGMGGAPVGGSGGAGGCGTLFVKEGSLPNNDGCGESTPLPSLSAALTLAKTLGGIKEVRVCAGNYPEPATLVLDRDIALRGSFDCPQNAAGAWKDPPKKAAGATSQLLFGSATAVRFEAGVGRGAALEGFVLGASAGPPDGTPSIVIDIAGGASPTVRFNRVLGSKLTAAAPGFGAAGVRIGLDSGALLDGNVIGSFIGRGTVSATGTAAAAGSVGLYLDRPGLGLVIQNNEIAPAAGIALDSATIGTVGVFLRLGAESVALKDNQILPSEGRFEGGNIKDAAKSVTLGVGLLVRRAPEAPATASALDVSGGAIAGPLGTSVPLTGLVGVAVSPSVFGVYLGTPGTPKLDATFDRVRLYGGDLSAPSTAATGQRTPQSFGVFATNTSLTMHSSLLHGGGLLGTTPFPRAALLSGPATFTGDYLTAVAGRAQIEPSSEQVALNEVLFLLGGPSVKVALTNSLLVGPDDPAFAVFGGEGTCQKPASSEPNYSFTTSGSVYFHHQDLASPTNKQGAFVSGIDGCPMVSTVAGATSEATAGHIVGDLVQVVGAVGNETVQVPAIKGCGDAKACLSVVFPNYTYTDKKQVLALANVALRPSCATAVPDVLTGSAPASSLPTEAVFDLVGNDRSKAGRVGPGALLSCTQ